jgi:hypothetical protein
MVLFQQTRLLLEVNFSKLQLTTEKTKKLLNEKRSKYVAMTRKEAKEST